MEKGLKINARFAGEGSEGSARRKRAGSKGSEDCGVAGATVLYAASRHGWGLRDLPALHLLF